MHSVRVSSASPHSRALVAPGNSPWVARLVALAALLVTWLGAGNASAGEVSSGVSSGMARLASSASAPPMSPRGEEPSRSRVDSFAPLCDIRCATTFAPAPQFQDSEVALAVSDDEDDDSAMDVARMLPGSGHESQVSQDDPCTLAPPRVRPAPPGAERCPVPVVASKARAGVTSSLERPPRA